MSMAGKTALVTGAGRGIGAATAIALASNGAAVGVGVRRFEDGEQVAAAIESAGGRALPVLCDVADPNSVDDAVAAVTRGLGAIDVLVSNAGSIQPIARLAEAPRAEWLRTIEINLIGAFHCLHAVLPGMVERGSGVVVHLLSGAAYKPLEGWSAYCASKAGLSMLTRSLHEEYAGQGIRSIGFSPGLVDTGMQAEIRQSGVNPVSQLKRETLSSVDEPAAAIAFLCGAGGEAYAGREVDIRDKDFRAASGLPPL